MRELAIRASSTHLPQRVKKLILPHVGPETTVEDDPLNKPEQISWVLASQEPEQLAQFYAELFHCKASAGFSSRHWLVPLGAGSSLEIYQPSSRRIFPQRGRALAPCLRLTPASDPLEALMAWVERWQPRGVTVDQHPRLESFGAECWLFDPEQNSFLVVVPGQRTR